MGKSKPTKLADQPAENLKGTSPKPRLTQQSIRESFSLWTEEGQKTKDIERAIMQMICVDTLPLQTVEKAGFKNLLKVVIPQWKHLKSRTHYTRVEIPRLFNEYENRLKEELSEADSLAISFDLFADEGNIHQVIGAVVHFLKDSVQVYRVLGIIDVKNDSHRGMMIKNKLEDLFESFDIKDKVRLTEIRY